MTGQFPANWHPDPLGRFEHRYWDGREWTHHVSTHGRQEIDRPVALAPVPTVTRASRKVQQQVLRAGVPEAGQANDAALFNESVLVVNQKAKLFELSAEYAVHDQQGRQIGVVRQVDQRLLRKAMGGSAHYATHRFQVLDMSGRVLIALTRPAKFVKSTMIVSGPDGTHGEIVQKTAGVLGKVRFSLESGGQRLGSINAEDWHAWDFNIRDESGAEIARITKTWAGWATERFTKADHYVVRIHRPLQEPLRCLVIGAALAVDVALKQGKQTSGTRRRRRYK
jgi:uncharacterized protein YxjI